MRSIPEEGVVAPLHHAQRVQVPHQHAVGTPPRMQVVRENLQKRLQGKKDESGTKFKPRTQSEPRAQSKSEPKPRAEPKSESFNETKEEPEPKHQEKHKSEEEAKASQYR